MKVSVSALKPAEVQHDFKLLQRALDSNKSYAKPKNPPNKTKKALQYKSLGKNVKLQNAEARRNVLQADKIRRVTAVHKDERNAFRKERFHLIAQLQKKCRTLASNVQYKTDRNAAIADVYTILKEGTRTSQQVKRKRESLSNKQDKKYISKSTRERDSSMSKEQTIAANMLETHLCFMIDRARASDFTDGSEISESSKDEYEESSSGNILLDHLESEQNSDLIEPHTHIPLWESGPNLGDPPVEIPLQLSILSERADHALLAFNPKNKYEAVATHLGLAQKKIASAEGARIDLHRALGDLERAKSKLKDITDAEKVMQRTATLFGNKLEDIQSELRKLQKELDVLKEE